MLPRNIKSDSSQKKILRAFAKLGFEILPGNYGTGSHRIVRDPKTDKEFTIQHRIDKYVIKDYCKKLESIGYDSSKFNNLI
jgi:predicted RNA binding protein YcfA (HicA-like mRNA interferase family)